MIQHTIFSHWLASSVHRSPSIRRLLSWNTRTSSEVSTIRWLNRHYCRETSRKIPCSTNVSNRRIKIRPSLKRAMRKTNHPPSITTGSFLTRSWTQTSITKMLLKTSYSMKQLKSSSTLWSLVMTMTHKLSCPMQAAFTKSTTSF